MGEPSRLQAIAEYTGYPVAMLLAAFGQGDLVRLDALMASFAESPRWATVRDWQPMPAGLPGRVRFFPDHRRDRWRAALHPTAPLFHAAPPATMDLGFAAGNVPGNGLLLALLLHVANHTILGGSSAPPPAVLVRNSRQAPLLEPWVLTAIEQVDPELVAGISMLVWDYDDAALQRLLLGRVDTVVATASDPVIASLDAQLQSLGRPVRFLRHGHKISFAVIGREALTGDPALAATLAALDSTFWDQYGCLSARVHFVERGGRGSPEDYAVALAEAMGTLAHRLPRGVAPRRFLHQAYDTYKLLEADGDVRVLTHYDDDSLVVLDMRDWSAPQWRAAVNRCTGRVVVVRPVDDLGEIAPRYLRALPPANLQSMSVAVSGERVLALAEAAGACGVTALRSLGRAAFPQLAYSWDGLLPLDMGNNRPAGRFTTLETDDPLSELAPTLARLEL
ncbi:MAG: hypothetical protein GX601_14965, partial [Anaerolineales bacterium]|nr:hypothetical protein [Anaerolineales bacterium]